MAEGHRVAQLLSKVMHAYDVGQSQLATITEIVLSAQCGLCIHVPECAAGEGVVVKSKCCARSAC